MSNDIFTEQELQDLRTQFDLADRDGNGSISAKELTSILKRSGQVVTLELVMKKMSEADLDGSGAIDYDEFLRVCAACKGFIKP
jgi:Ca2+-binding EF-hand superfamily protein